MKDNYSLQSDNPKCLLRLDAKPTKEYSGHGKAYIPIKKFSYLRNMIDDLREGSYHQVLYKSSDMNIFFDVDFKNLSSDLIDTEQFKYDLEQAFSIVLKSWGYDTKYQIKHQSNNLELGFHTHIKGYKINLSVLQFLAFKIIEEFESYDDYYKGLIDTKVYKQLGSLRNHGFKYDLDTLEYTNYYQLSSKEVEDYLIYHTIQNSTFVTVPSYLIDEYREFHSVSSQKTTQVESKLQQDVISQLIRQDAQKHQLDIQDIVVSNNGILVNLNNESCPICQRIHSQIVNRRLYAYERNGTIYLNCFQNNNKPKKEFKVIRITTQLSEQASKKTISELMQIQMKIDVGQNQIGDVTQQYIQKATSMISMNNIQESPIELSQSFIRSFFRRQNDIYFAYQMSTGKSKQCYKLTKYARELNLSVCHITSRKTFTDFNIANYKATHYREHQSVFRADDCMNLMIQVESIMRVDTSEEYPKVLVFDEFISLQQHILSSEYMKPQVWNKLVDLIANCRHLIVMDAYLNKDRIMSLLTKLRKYDEGGKYTWKQGTQQPLSINKQNDENQYQRKVETVVNMQIGVPSKSELISEIVSNVILFKQLGIKTVVYSTSKKLGYEIQKSLIDVGLRACYLNGDNDVLDFNDKLTEQLHKHFKTYMIENPTRFNDFDVVIYTQTLGIGISLENNPDFSNLIAIGDQQRVSGSNEVSQSLFRFRNIQTIKLYTHGFNFGELLETIPSAHEAIKKMNIFETVNPAINSEVYQFQLHCIVERSIQKHYHGSTYGLPLSFLKRKWETERSEG